MANCLKWRASPYVQTKVQLPALQQNDNPQTARSIRLWRNALSSSAALAWASGLPVFERCWQNSSTAHSIHRI
jgi:hypothetical protein